MLDQLQNFRRLLDYVGVRLPSNVSKWSWFVLLPGGDYMYVNSDLTKTLVTSESPEQLGI